MTGQACTSRDVIKARCKLFAMKNNVRLILPTRVALKQHVRQAMYEGGHVWGQTVLPAPALPSPTDWDWVKTSEQTYEPHWTTLPEASEVCRVVGRGRSAGNLSPANASKAARRSASARRQSWNAHNYVHVTGSALRTELGTLKQSYTKLN